jgi:hypothetical protein
MGEVWETTELAKFVIYCYNFEVKKKLKAK